MEQNPDKNGVLDLALFTDRFSRLIDFGISLVGIFEILRDDAPASMAEPLRSVQAEIENGSMLSRALGLHPATFPPLYTAMVRVGEVGGILETALQFLSEMLEEEWTAEIRAKRPASPPLIRLDPAASTWLGMDRIQQRFLLMLFCRALSDLIGQGVPFRIALGGGGAKFEGSAAFFPENEKAVLKVVAETMPEVRHARHAHFMLPERGIAGPLAALGFVPQLVTGPMTRAETFDRGVTSMAPALDVSARMLQKEVRLHLVGQAFGR